MKPSIVPGNNSYTETVNSIEKIIIFGDSTTLGIKLNAFNFYINKGYAKMKSFVNDLLKSKHIQSG